MGIPEGLFVEQETIPMRIFCAICLDVVQNARSTPCKHVFCDVCIEQSLQAKNACPYCRRPCRHADVVDALHVREWVGKREVYCHEDPEERCLWRGAHAELQAHLVDCPKRRQQRNRNKVSDQSAVLEIEDLLAVAVGDLRELLLGLPVKQLLQLIQRLHMPRTNIIEKRDMVNAVLSAVEVARKAQLKARELYQRLGVGHLRRILDNCGVDHSGCIEKADLVALAFATRLQPLPDYPGAVGLRKLREDELRALLAEDGVHCDDTTGMSDLLTLARSLQLKPASVTSSSSSGPEVKSPHPSAPAADDTPPANDPVWLHIQQMSVHALKELLDARGVDSSNCLEKRDLMHLAWITRALGVNSSRPGPDPSSAYRPAPSQASPSPEELFRTFFQQAGLWDGDVNVSASPNRGARGSPDLFDLNPPPRPGGVDIRISDPTNIALSSGVSSGGTESISLVSPGFRATSAVRVDNASSASSIHITTSSSPNVSGNNTAWASSSVRVSSTTRVRNVLRQAPSSQTATPATPAAPSPSAPSASSAPAAASPTGSSTGSSTGRRVQGGTAGGNDDGSECCVVM